MSAPIRVLLVDDDALMRAGLRAVLSTDDGIAVVGEAQDGRAAIARAAALAPDVVLMDVRMPVLDGVAATRALLDAQSAPAAPRAPKVIVLTTFEEDEYIFGALAAGAAGFLLKRTPPEELMAAIRSVAAGDALLSPSVTRRVIQRMAGRRLATAPADDRLVALTPRERDVLDLVARGLTNREVAAALVIEETTVKTHVKRVLAKLDLRNRVQAVIYAYENGLMAPRET